VDLKDELALKNDIRFVKMWIEYVSHWVVSRVKAIYSVVEMCRV
jgi:hypothetical protein